MEQNKLDDAIKKMQKDKEGKAKEKFGKLTPGEVQSAIERWDLLQHVNSKEFGKWVITLSAAWYKLLLDTTVTIHEIKDKDKLTANHVQSVEKGFCEGTQAYAQMSPAEQEKTQHIWKEFESKLQESLKKLRQDSELKEIRSSGITSNQLLDQLKQGNPGLINKITKFIEEKTGFDPTNPMRSLSKLMPGNDKQDPTQTVADSDVEIGLGTVQTTIKSELFGKIIGFSTIASVGFLAPLIPLYAIHKIFPADVLPLVGGLKVDGLLAEGTAWNLTDNKTTMTVGNNSNSCHVDTLKEKRHNNILSQGTPRMG